MVPVSEESVARIQPLRGWPRPGSFRITHTSNGSYLVSLAPQGRPPALRGHAVYGPDLYTLELRDRVSEPRVSIGGQPGVGKVVRSSYSLDRPSCVREAVALGTEPAVLDGLCPVKL